MESQHTSCPLPLAISEILGLFLLDRLCLHLKLWVVFHSHQHTSALFHSHQVFPSCLRQVWSHPLWLGLLYLLRDLISHKCWVRYRFIVRYESYRAYLRYCNFLPITDLSNGKSLPSVPVIINQVNKITTGIMIFLQLSCWRFEQNFFFALFFFTFVSNTI